MTKYYGVFRNCKGYSLNRYLYTLEQLKAKDPCFPGGEPLSYDGAFRADNTYTVIKLETEEDVERFVKGQDFQDCGYDDPELIDLAEWYSDFQTWDMFDGTRDLTACQFLEEKKLSPESLVVIDRRYTELLEQGYAEDIFYGALRHKRYSEITA